MRSGTAQIFVLGVLSTWHSVGLAQSPATQKPAPEAPKNYSSPNAVFDAYREACAKGDTRTTFLCLTPELRDEEVFEAYFACNLKDDSPKVVAVLKKFGVEISVVDAEFYRLYKAKYGADPKKLRADWDDKLAKALAAYAKKHREKPLTPDSYTIPESVAKEVGPPPQDDDPELLRKILKEKVTDKLAFVVEAVAATRSADAHPSRIGSLKNVRVQGDVATGQAAETTYGYHKGPREPAKKVANSSDSTFRFRKTKDGWLISGFGSD
jgi:hypothetical protein